MREDWKQTVDKNYVPKSQSTQQQYQPHCPICGSPNVEKISVANKVGKGITFWNIFYW